VHIPTVNTLTNKST